MNFLQFFRFGASPARSAAAVSFSKSFCHDNLKLLARTFVNKADSLLKDKSMSISINLFRRQTSNLSSFTQERGVSSKAPALNSLSKKKIHKKRYALDSDPEQFEEGRYSVMAYATAEEYDLEKLKAALMQQKLYTPQK